MVGHVRGSLSKGWRFASPAFRAPGSFVSGSSLGNWRVCRCRVGGRSYGRRYGRGRPIWIKGPDAAAGLGGMGQRRGVARGRGGGQARGFAVKNLFRRMGMAVHVKPPSPSRAEPAQALGFQWPFQWPWPFRWMGADSQSRCREDSPSTCSASPPARSAHPSASISGTGSASCAGLTHIANSLARGGSAICVTRLSSPYAKKQGP